MRPTWTTSTSRSAVLEAAIPRAAAVVVLLVVSDLVLADAAAPELRRRALEVRQWAEVEIDNHRPGWAPELKALWSEGFEKAVLSQADKTLGDEQVTAIKRVVSRAAQVSYSHPPRAQFAFETLVWEWIVGDILVTPPTSPADIEALKAQVRELSGYLAHQLDDELDVFPDAGARAAARQERRYLEVIDQPKYRFDRRPMAEAAMESARSDIRQSIQDAAPDLRALLEVVLGWPTEDALKRVEFDGRVLAAKTMASVVHKYWNWRHPPQNEEYRAAREAAAQGHAELRRVKDLARWVKPVAHLLASFALGLDPVGDAPVRGVGELPSEQARIARQLRGKQGTLAGLHWYAHIDLPQADEHEQHWQSLEVDWSIRPGGLRMGVTGSPRTPMAKGGTDGPATVVYDIAPDNARVLCPNGDLVGHIVRGLEWMAADGEMAGGRTWQAAAPGPELMAVATLSRPTGFQWTRAGEEPEQGALQHYTARAEAGIYLPDTGETASFHYWFDPDRGAIVKVAALDRAGGPLWETVWSGFETLPGGSVIALRSVTTLSDRAVSCRRDAQRGGPLRAMRPLIASQIVTEYKWLSDARVRVPVRHQIVDEHGEEECVVEFREHEVEPAMTE